jgi:hypothetical protein
MVTYSRILFGSEINTQLLLLLAVHHGRGSLSREDYRGGVFSLTAGIYFSPLPNSQTNPLTDQCQNSDAQGQLTAAVDELLDQLQSKFDNVSKEMFGKCLFSPCQSSRRQSLHIPHYLIPD